MRCAKQPQLDSLKAKYRILKKSAHYFMESNVNSCKSIGKWQIPKPVSCAITTARNPPLKIYSNRRYINDTFGLSA